ncbi:MAG: double-strand break repair helicase AddA, partial [Pseudomonadota bacterium]
MDDATLSQVIAAEPDASTWLSANAGSGKTKVLIDRVARLLLGGVEPQNILCLTYTKAAASEMQNRLFERLGDWAMKPVDELRAALLALGAPEDMGVAQLSEARRLFARAIETPGGLRIQTIHSYCAALLRRFPLEAGVSPNFVEMDDRSASLLRDAVLEDLAETRPKMIQTVAEHLTSSDLSGLVASVLSNREHFGKTPTDDEVFGWFSLDPDIDLTQIVTTCFDGSEKALIAAVSDIATTQSKIYQSFAERLRCVDLDAPDIDDYDLLCALFLYKGERAGQSKSANFPQSNHKKAVDAFAPVIDDLHAFMDRVAEAKMLENSLYAAQKTRALHAFAGAFLPAYEAAKSLRGLLDFDDLILRTRALLSDPDVAQWVLYRLDGGLDHILVDEAQDTSPAQWQVIERLAQELAAGLGAREDRRTIFVVGDKKQSIYSFQGADPREFDRMRDFFDERLLGSDAPLRRRELEYSFRSSDAILRFVDQSVDVSDMRHRAFHNALPGRVDIWPATPKVEAPERAHWYDPVDIVTDAHHMVTLAREIAAFMKRTIGVETIPLAKGGRQVVRASDFLILVRRRSTLFEAIIRECKTLGLPVAGADRLKLGAELAVKDLTAVLSFLATPEDDLSLAAALKSPLFEWDEQALYDLAAKRDEVYLWAELRRRRDDFPTTFETLNDLRDQADFLRPYDLLERILTRHDGRRRLIGRLGAEAEDGIDALLAQSLNYERTDVPSLTGFLTWLETDEVEIKRQLDNAGDLIRVMTVHGAKGLESPIVILPDTAKRAAPAGDQIVMLDTGAAVWRVPAAEQPDVLRTAVERDKTLQSGEQERLFYVAATRAETWLIFAAAGDVGTDDASWYSKAVAGAEGLG